MPTMAAKEVTVSSVNIIQMSNASIYHAPVLYRNFKQLGLCTDSSYKSMKFDLFNESLLSPESREYLINCVVISAPQYNNYMWGIFAVLILHFKIEG